MCKVVYLKVVFKINKILKKKGKIINKESKGNFCGPCEVKL